MIDVLNSWVLNYILEYHYILFAGYVDHGNVGTMYPLEQFDNEADMIARIAELELITELIIPE